MSTNSFFRREAVLPGLCINLCVTQEGELFSRFDVGHVLDVALGEYDVDLFEGSILGFRVEEAAEY